MSNVRGEELRSLVPLQAAWWGRTPWRQNPGVPGWLQKERGATRQTQAKCYANLPFGGLHGGGGGRPKEGGEGTWVGAAPTAQGRVQNHFKLPARPRVNKARLVEIVGCQFRSIPAGEKRHLNISHLVSEDGEWTQVSVGRGGERWDKAGRGCRIFQRPILLIAPVTPSAPGLSSKKLTEALL